MPCPEELVPCLGCQILQTTRQCYFIYTNNIQVYMNEILPTLHTPVERQPHKNSV